MNLSCCMWALTGPDSEILPPIAELGFQWVDIQPGMLTTEAAQIQARELGLRVVCLGASFGMPEGAALDSADEGARAAAVAHVEKALAHGAALGVTAAYVVPDFDDSEAALARYARSLTTVADRAADLGLTLGIEHFPGRSLPTAAGTLDYIREIGHPNLSLLFDLGHVLISDEDPAAIIKAAGPRLSYVHLDDNDGQGDLHWSLTDGVLTEATLRRTFEALREIGYDGPISLELHPELPDPLTALKESRKIVLNNL